MRLVKIRHFGHYRIMDQETAIEAFAALAQPSRMTIFRLLVRAGPEGLQVGEISRRLNIVTSTLSGHLSILKRAGLLTSTRFQREIHYAAHLTVVNDLVGFLLADCCEGQSGNCSEILSLLETG
jgi:ArsR family transcriptional regulator, arsenate/arsenite/antimonite-responsive transcriptional repressor